MSLSSKPSTTQLSYIAGYIDGEGCIRWDRTTPSLSVETCNPAPLKLIAKVFGGKITSRLRTGERQTKRTVHTIRYYGDQCIVVVKMILPYLIEKKDQAEDIIEIRRLKQKLKEAKKKNHTQ